MKRKKTLEQENEEDEEKVEEDEEKVEDEGNAEEAEEEKPDEDAGKIKDCSKDKVHCSIFRGLLNAVLGFKLSSRPRFSLQNWGRF